MESGNCAGFLRCEGELDFLALVRAKRFEERCCGINYRARLTVGSRLLRRLPLDSLHADVPKRSREGERRSQNNQFSHSFSLPVGP